MSYKVPLLFILLLISSYTFAQKTKIPKGALRGDFDGDGKTEYAWIVKPKLKASGEDCEGKCEVRIVFSNTAMKAITVKNSIGGYLTSWGDLAGNHKDVIGFHPEWFTSCWSPYYVYTIHKGEWCYLVPPFSTHCNQWEAGIKPIERVPGRKGFVKIHYSAIDTADIKMRLKIERITFSPIGQK